jgi:hypothetical protein
MSTGRYMRDPPAWNFSTPGAKTWTTGRYKPRLLARADYRELELRILGWYANAYGDLATIKHFVYAISYGASFERAIVPVAKSRGQHPLEIAMAYSLWQTSGDDLAGT